MMIFVTDLFGLLTVFFTTVYHCQGAAVTCATPVSEGDPTNITCHFNEDIRLTKKNIRIQKTPLDTTAHNSLGKETVVDCYWWNYDNFKCDTRRGYKLEGSVHTQATVKILRASEDYVGRYTCTVLPTDPSQPDDIETCDILLTDEEDSLNIEPSVSPFEQTLEQIKQIVALGLAILVIVPTVVIAGMVFKSTVVPKLWQLIRRKKSGNLEDVYPVSPEHQPLQPTDQSNPGDSASTPATEENQSDSQESQFQNKDKAILIDMPDKGVSKQDVLDLQKTPLTGSTSLPGSPGSDALASEPGDPGGLAQPTCDPSTSKSHEPSSSSPCNARPASAEKPQGESKVTSSRASDGSGGKVHPTMTADNGLDLVGSPGPSNEGADDTRSNSKSKKEKQIQGQNSIEQGDHEINIEETPSEVFILSGSPKKKQKDKGCCVQ